MVITDIDHRVIIYNFEENKSISISIGEQIPLYVFKDKQSLLTYDTESGKFNFWDLQTLNITSKSNMLHVIKYEEDINKFFFFERNSFWRYPYYMCEHEGKCDIWEIKSFFNWKYRVENISELYFCDNINIHNCNFTKVITDKKMKKIIQQYGGIL